MPNITKDADNRVYTQIRREIKDAIRHARRTDPNLEAFSLKDLKMSIAERTGLGETLQKPDIKAFIKEVALETVASKETPGSASASPTRSKRSPSAPPAKSPKKTAPKARSPVKPQPASSPSKSPSKPPLRVKDRNVRHIADEIADDEESDGDGHSEKAQHGHGNSRKRQRSSTDSPEPKPSKSVGRKKQRVTEEEEDEEGSTPKKKGKSAGTARAKAEEAPRSVDSTERLFMGTSEAEQYSSLDEDDEEAEKTVKSRGAKGKTSDGEKQQKRESNTKGKGSSKSSAAGRKKGSRKSGGASSSSGDLRKDEVVRLKSYVVACGMRKQWTKFFESKGCAGETPEMYLRQKKVLQEMLSELGMSGRLSMEKARKIREEREFKMELEDIGVLSGPATTRRAARASKAASAPSDSDNDDENNSEHEKENDSSTSMLGKKAETNQDDGDDSDEEGYTGPKARKSTEAAQRRRNLSSLAAFAAELNSSDAE